MKKKGCICDFAIERDAAIMKAYRAEATKTGTINFDDIATRVAASPSPRFWVSEERAMGVLSAIRRGINPLARMIPSKQRMYCEIHRRVEALRKARPTDALVDIVTEVVNSPAPEFYMTGRYARDLIFMCIRNAKSQRR